MLTKDYPSTTPKTREIPSVAHTLYPNSKSPLSILNPSVALHHLQSFTHSP